MASSEVIEQKGLAKARPASANQPIDAEASAARLQGRIAVGLFLAYLLVAVVLTFTRGGTLFTPDRIGILLLAGAAMLGQGKAFVRDWGPFVLLLFGYELMRGVADNMANLGQMTREDHGSIQVERLLALDRWLAFGNVPSIWLQDRFYVPGKTHWYDAMAALVYLLHFVLPLAFGFMLWLRSRPAFRAFTTALLAMSYGAFVFYLFLPTAPPWLAQEWGYLDDLQRPSYQAYKLFLPEALSSIDTFKLWSAASPNPVAALPSLHVAFPWLVLLFALRHFGTWGWLMLPYNAAVWFAVVYLSQHWVVDVFAGIAWATAIYVLVDRGYPRVVAAYARRQNKGERRRNRGLDVPG